jgi:competence protein ComEA
MKRIGIGLSVVIIGLGLAYVFNPQSTIRNPQWDDRSHSQARNQQLEAVARLNINTASAQELESLPGLGPVTAQKIIEYRETHGPFARPEDLLIVEGIGEKTYRPLADLIRTE